LCCSDAVDPDLLPRQLLKSRQTWEANGDQDYHTVVSQDSAIEVQGGIAETRDPGAVGSWAQRRNLLLLFLGVGLAMAVVALPRRQTVSLVQRLAFLRGDVAKLIVFAVVVKAMMLGIGYLSYAAWENKNIENTNIYFSQQYLSQTIAPLRYADVTWYLELAKNGYEHRPFSSEKKANWAFYPLWPAMLWLGGQLTGNMFVFGIALSNILLLVSIVYLYKLISIDFEADIAYTTAALLIIFPTSYFFSRPGPEALFLFLSVASLYYAKRNRWIIAGILAALIAITRIQGVLLLPALLFIYFKAYTSSRRHDLGALSLLLVPISWCCFMGYLYFLTGNPLASFDIQKAWGNGSSYPFHPIVSYISEPSVISYYGWDLSLVSFIFVVGAVALTLMMIKDKSIPREYLIYTLLSMLIVVSKIDLNGSLRYILAIFPLYLMLSLIIRNRKDMYNLVFYAFASLQMFYVVSLIHYFNWAAN
jgi:hypothetical protein